MLERSRRGHFGALSGSGLVHLELWSRMSKVPSWWGHRRLVTTPASPRRLVTGSACSPHHKGSHRATQKVARRLPEGCQRRLRRRD